MATTAFVNILTPPGSYGSTATDLGLDTATTNDVKSGADDSDFAVTGRELLIVFNSTGGSVNLLLTSVAEPVTQRATNPNPLSIAIPAGDTRMFGPFARIGWAASNGRMKMQASAAGLRAAVLTLPTVS